MATALSNLYTPGRCDKTVWAQARSLPNGHPTDLVVSSCSDICGGGIVMCWVTLDGELHNPRYLSQNLDSVSRTHTHTENSYVGHAFVFILDRQISSEVGSVNNSLPSHLAEVSSEDFLCLYQLGKSKEKFKENGDEEEKEKLEVLPEVVEDDEVGEGGGRHMLTLLVGPDHVRASVCFTPEWALLQQEAGDPVSDAHIQYEPSEILGFTVFRYGVHNILSIEILTLTTTQLIH